ncbi:uncharacterized protein LOC121379968 [Gigantopelta aegis]|uniref:uncharacterized protein LOC121379968 n=1 Tax=Gigantopelta aegis TaxID=1735272 RepID=UPI001B88A3F6|nr:uncharacterized protein LOC121379968 [Gigantopelta aegis]
MLLLLLSLVLSSAVLGDDSSRLKEVEQEFAEWRELESPEFATEIGVHKYDDLVEDFSLTALESKKTKMAHFINRLYNVSRQNLSQRDGYSYDVFLDTISTIGNNYKWRLYGPLNPVNFLEGDQIDPAFTIKVMLFGTKGDYENYIARLNAMPAQFDQYIDRFKEAVRLGHTYHKVSIARVPGQIDQLLVGRPEDSIYYKPFRDLHNLTIPQTEKTDLVTRGTKAVTGLLQAFKTVKEYIVTEYLHHTRGTYGVGGWNLGGEYYKAALKWHISTDDTPYQVHQKGLHEVARITVNMRKIMRKHGFSGTVHEYYESLKQQPRFHKNSADELLQEYKNIVFNRIYPQLPRIFKDIPHLPVVVEAMPNDGPGGMYLSGTQDGSRAGIFQVNVKRPNETNTFSMLALTLHETVPGHHLQSIYAISASLPSFQRNIQYGKYFAIPYNFPFYTAYTEGWGLYAESLGETLGLYRDDYELMGRYGEEIFRACRLVIDTGLHYFGWSRNRSIEYMTAHTPFSRNEIETEIDRYITWPGQACAYKIGELKIRELREHAKMQLGSDFDIRDFHSVILNNGPVPLNTLDTIVTDWINSVKAGTGNRVTSHPTPGGPLIIIPNIIG